jgi:hypothetical protein
MCSEYPAWVYPHTSHIAIRDAFTTIYAEG